MKLQNNSRIKLKKKKKRKIIYYLSQRKVKKYQTPKHFKKIQQCLYQHGIKSLKKLSKLKYIFELLQILEHLHFFILQLQVNKPSSSNGIPNIIQFTKDSILKPRSESRNRLFLNGIPLNEKVKVVPFFKAQSRIFYSDNRPSCLQYESW